jgi:hypothetical protein
MRRPFPGNGAVTKGYRYHVARTLEGPAHALVLVLSQVLNAPGQW